MLKYVGYAISVSRTSTVGHRCTIERILPGGEFHTIGTCTMTSRKAAVAQAVSVVRHLRKQGMLYV